MTNGAGVQPTPDRSSTAGRCGRALRLLLLAAGALVLLALLHRFGADALASAVTHVTWGQFFIICLLQGLTVAVDAYGWQLTLPCRRAPLRRLVAARFAGDAVNVLTAFASVGGEAVKAWILRREVPYEESVPSLISSKTAEVVAQALLLALALLVASTADLVGSSLRTAMAWLLVVELLAVAGFIGVQLTGVLGKAGRLFSWAGTSAVQQARQLDRSLRDFYRERWGSFALSIGCYFVGWLLGVVQALVILQSLGLGASLASATVVEGLWSAVRFATFFIPASLGSLEGANAAAFGAFGWAASAGLAFTLVRRGCQAVWVGIGVVVLIAMRPSDARAATRTEGVALGVE